MKRLMLSSVCALALLAAIAPQQSWAELHPSEIDQPSVSGPTAARVPLNPAELNGRLRIIESAGAPTKIVLEDGTFVAYYYKETKALRDAAGEQILATSPLYAPLKQGLANNYPYTGGGVLPTPVNQLNPEELNGRLRLADFESTTPGTTPRIVLEDGTFVAYYDKKSNIFRDAAGAPIPVTSPLYGPLKQSLVNKSPYTGGGASPLYVAPANYGKPDWTPNMRQLEWNSLTDAEKKSWISNPTGSTRPAPPATTSGGSKITGSITLPGVGTVKKLANGYTLDATGNLRNQAGAIVAMVDKYGVIKSALGGDLSATAKTAVADLLKKSGVNITLGAGGFEQKNTYVAAKDNGSVYYGADGNRDLTPELKMALAAAKNPSASLTAKLDLNTPPSIFNQKGWNADTLLKEWNALTAKKKEAWALKAQSEKIAEANSKYNLSAPPVEFTKNLKPAAAQSKWNSLTVAQKTEWVEKAEKAANLSKVPPYFVRNGMTLDQAQKRWDSLTVREKEAEQRAALDQETDLERNKAIDAKYSKVPSAFVKGSTLEQAQNKWNKLTLKQKQDWLDKTDKEAEAEAKAAAVSNKVTAVTIPATAPQGYGKPDWTPTMRQAEWNSLTDQQKLDWIKSTPKSTIAYPSGSAAEASDYRMMPGSVELLANAEGQPIARVSLTPGSVGLMDFSGKLFAFDSPEYLAFQKLVGSNNLLLSPNIRKLPNGFNEQEWQILTQAERESMLKEYPTTTDYSVHRLLIGTRTTPLPNNLTELEWNNLPKEERSKLIWGR